MTGDGRLPATRANLLRSTRRLAQVRQGATLLKRKRRSLVDDLLARARTAVTSREAIEAQASRAWELVFQALSALGGDGLAPFGWPVREVDVEMQAVDRWGIRAMEMTDRPALVRTVAARGVAPDRDDAVAHEAARELERLLEQVLDAAPREHAMRRLGQALSRTTRLVNTLEQRVAARLLADLSRILRTLGEREREEQLRIKRLVRRRADHRAAPPE